jgi:hypothetical protein
MFTSNHVCKKPKKPMKVEWESKSMFQKKLTAKLPLSKGMMGPNCKMSMVRCKICTFIEKIKN